jgi:hypothetical protein
MVCEDQALEGNEGVNHVLVPAVPQVTTSLIEYWEH